MNSLTLTIYYICLVFVIVFDIMYYHQIRDSFSIPFVRMKDKTDYMTKIGEFRIITTSLIDLWFSMLLFCYSKYTFSHQSLFEFDDNREKILTNDWKNKTCVQRLKIKTFFIDFSTLAENVKGNDPPTKEYFFSRKWSSTSLL